MAIPFLPLNTPRTPCALQGAWSPSSLKPGGTLFYAFPVDERLKVPIASTAATLEYEVAFPADFDWGKGKGHPHTVDRGTAADE
jgi:hypothetical protein